MNKRHKRILKQIKQAALNKPEVASVYTKTSHRGLWKKTKLTAKQTKRVML
jgi:hypothetical protein